MPYLIMIALISLASTRATACPNMQSSRAIKRLLESVKDQDSDFCCGYSAKVILDMTNVSADKCDPDELLKYTGFCLDSSYLINAREMIDYVEDYKQALYEICAKNLEDLLKKALDKIGDDDLNAIKKYLNYINKDDPSPDDLSKAEHTYLHDVSWARSLITRDEAKKEQFVQRLIRAEFYFELVDNVVKVSLKNRIDSRANEEFKKSLFGEVWLVRKICRKYIKEVMINEYKYKKELNKKCLDLVKQDKELQQTKSVWPKLGLVKLRKVAE